MKAIQILLRLGLLSVATTCMAQVNPNLENGVKPFGSYDASKIDSVNLTNGALQVKIPLFSVPQRGIIGSNTSLELFSKTWIIKQICNTITQTCKGYWQSTKPAGSTSGSGILLITDGIPGMTTAAVKINPAYTTYFRTIYDAEGNGHQLVATSATAARSVDGSGILCTACINDSRQTQPSTGGIYLRNGLGPGQQSGSVVEDPNGNNFSLTTDTMGRSLGTTAMTSDTSGCTGTFPITYANLVTVPGVNGVNRIVKLCYASFTLKTNFNTTFYDMYGN
jgi:hypothetical protein